MSVRKRLLILGAGTFFLVILGTIFFSSRSSNISSSTAPSYSNSYFSISHTEGFTSANRSGEITLSNEKDGNIVITKISDYSEDKEKGLLNQLKEGSYTPKDSSEKYRTYMQAIDQAHNYYIVTPKSMWRLSFYGVSDNLINKIVASFNEKEDFIDVLKK